MKEFVFLLNYYKFILGKINDIINYIGINIIEKLFIIVTMGFLVFFNLWYIYFFFFKYYTKIDFIDPVSILSIALIELYYFLLFFLIIIILMVLSLICRIVYLCAWRGKFYWNDLIFDFVENIHVLVLYFHCFYLYLYSSENKRFKKYFFEYVYAYVEECGHWIAEHFSYLYKNIKINFWYYDNWHKEDANSFINVCEISAYKFLEISWIIMPLFILGLFVGPSFSLIYSMDAAIDAVFTVKVIGRQWYWTYEMNGEIYDNDLILKNNDNFGFVEDVNDFISNLINNKVKFNKKIDSMIIYQKDLLYGTHRLLEVDNRLILPVGVPIKFLVTSTDVLHSWAVPSMGIKVDAVPGRINQFISEIKRPGVFYGQCSELCGVAHGFMPIVIQAIPFNEWEIYIKNN